MNRRARRIFAVAGAVALLIIGCATVAPEHAGYVEDAQRFADGAREHFGGHRVRVFVSEDLPAGVGATHSAGTIVIRPSLFANPHVRALLAHEIAHATLSHSGGVRDQAESRSRELDANARAVEILVRVDGLAERDAATKVGAMIAAISQTQKGAARPLPIGHLHPCDELRDLERRYPGDWARGLRCVEAAR